MNAFGIRNNHRYIYRISALLLLLFLSLNGCNSDAKKATGPPSELSSITVENYPRMDGSTATIPLGEALAAHVLSLSSEAASEYAAFSGTTKSYEKLMREEADLLIVYEPAESTMYHKESAGIEWEMATIGKDALVFLVNAKNPVSSLSPRQLQDIYAGEITNWKDVGGQDLEIKAYQRNETAGSQTMMLKLVMGSREIMKPPVMYVLSSMGSLLETLAFFNGTGEAIGYSVYYYAYNMNPNDGLRFLAVNDVMPNNETIREGQYPFVNDFYAVIRKDEPEDSPARQLYNFLISDHGQALVSQEGYVSVR